MKRIYFLFFTTLLLETAPITLQNSEVYKNTIKKENEIAKTGKISSPPGSYNLTKYLEKKAKKSKVNAERKKNQKRGPPIKKKKPKYT